MGVLKESWCFCSGSGRSERMKGNIFSSKGPAMAAISGGTGFLIHRNLLLTTHINLPSVAAAEAADVRLQDHVAARLVPHRFFITSSVLDLTIVGFDTMDADSMSQGQQPHFLKTCSNPGLDLGSVVYLLGHTEKKELTVGEGKVVIATDNLIKLSTDGVTWSPGSAGFDVHGNLAFMVCDPMKLASSPTAKSSSTSSSSSSSWKKDLPMQFGIPIPIICDWLNQHWEGSLDELSKPKLPLKRLMSTGQKSEHSCTSFTMRRVFKSAEGEIDDESASSQIISRPVNQPGSSCNAATNVYHEENPLANLRPSTHEQGIPTPEIYESPRLTAGPILRKENTQSQLLDINFPPRVPRATTLPLAIKQLLPNLDGNVVEKLKLQNPSRDDPSGSANPDADADSIPVESIPGDHSEVQSCSSPLEVLESQNEADGFQADYSSEGETMYSAETMESRNYTSPREGRFQQVGRSQSCVNYSRWGAAQRNTAAHRGALEMQRSLVQERKMFSQTAVSQRTRSNDFLSPTVSSIMKKRNNSEQQLPRPRQSTVQLSPRWI
ncbi:uncharacterized protein LOC131239588 [Magnolia sinica]|uniref:uncharacterized protein LOC131239588 n=1 Tax=Magnolia sinica TaxID=86752 RepID=UPI00265943BC|nr:uncharacterized protein LOC131239588 [Magnolia sinica]